MMRGLPSCTIILPVHNGLACLRDGFESLQVFTPRQDTQLLIVDDASDTVTTSWLQEQAKNEPEWISLHRNSKNIGFLASCNWAMNHSDSEYLLLLNSDVLLSPNWLERMLVCIGSDSRIAAVNPLCNRADNIDLPMAPGCSYLAMNDYLAKQIHTPRHYPDVVTCVGFCLLLRRSALYQIGLFDPVYGYGYCEESDLCMRLTMAGFRTVVADDVYVYHQGGGSFVDGNQRYLHNREIFDQRWGSEYQRQFRAFRRANPLRPVQDLFRLPQRWEPMPQIWQTARELYAEWQGARAAPRMLKIVARGLWRLMTHRMPNPVRTRVQDVTPIGRLRVVYVVDRLVVAGGVLSILQLVNELIRLGVEARIATLYEDPLIYQWIRLYTKPLIYRSAAELLAQFPESDFIFATHWNTAEWVHGLWKSGRTRQAGYLLQDYEPWFFQESNQLMRQQVKATYALLPHRIVMSDWLQHIIHQDGYASDKIPLGLDLGQFYPRDVDTGCPIVLAMARPGTPRRGFDATIAALSRVKQARPEVEVVLFGDRFLDRHPIPFIFRNEGLIVRQDRLAKLYSESTVFLDGSEFQGFGRCALEAMSCGSACVLTNIGGVMDYACDGENALLVPPNQPDLMCAAILRLLDDVTLRQHIVAGGQETANRYCHRREARATLDWLQKKLANL
jgi:GT2 family glycosyltransferase/glycosyltransferase involved in cell wall biosynthesis